MHELLNTLYDEKVWDVWIHKVSDKSFNEFKDSISNNQPAKRMTEDEIKATVLNSKSMLETFAPNTEERG